LLSIWVTAMRAFERDYRSKLREFVEAQLKALEASAPPEPIEPPTPPGPPPTVG
jgi:hypothetical protein